MRASVTRSGAREMMDLAWAIPDAIHLEIGEPDFTAPAHVVDAAVAALRAGRTAYPPAAGLPELRDALAAKLAKVNGIRATAEDIVVTNGGCQGLFNALSVLLAPGQAVALPDPGWPNYRSMAELLCLEPRFYRLRPENQHLPDPAEVRDLLAGGCRVLMLNSPSNPLGTVTPAPVMADILDLAERYGAWIVSDECYDEIYAERPPVSPAALAPDAHVVSVFSFSKTHAMTGWRVGYVHAAHPVSERLATTQEPLVLGISTPAQYGAIAALTQGAGHVGAMREQYRQRALAVVGEFARHNRAVHAPLGAFYLWLDIRDAGLDDRAFARRLLEREHVAITPGSSFGPSGAGFVRMSLAADQASLLQAVERIERQLVVA
jgi:aspartate/methionine/tyrosine aminotransferase